MGRSRQRCQRWGVDYLSYMYLLWVGVGQRWGVDSLICMSITDWSRHRGQSWESWN